MGNVLSTARILAVLERGVWWQKAVHAAIRTAKRALAVATGTEVWPDAGAGASGRRGRPGLADPSPRRPSSPIPRPAPRGGTLLCSSASRTRQAVASLRCCATFGTSASFWRRACPSSCPPPSPCGSWCAPPPSEHNPPHEAPNSPPTLAQIGYIALHILLRGVGWVQRLLARVRARFDPVARKRVELEARLRRAADYATWRRRAKRIDLLMG